MSPTTAELLGRVRRLEDLAAVHRLFQDYKAALDGKDFGAYAGLFTADGELVAGSGRVRGRAEIRTLVEGMLGNLLGAEAGQDVHLVLNPVVDPAVVDPAAERSPEPGGEQCRAQVTWVYLVRGDGDRPELAKVGHYEDEVMRDRDGSWRFRRRSAPTDIPAV